MRRSLRSLRPLGVVAAALAASPAVRAAPPAAPAADGAVETTPSPLGGASAAAAGSADVGAAASAAPAFGAAGRPEADAPEGAPGRGALGFGLELRAAVRVGWLGSAGYDPFAENDALAQASFGASYAVARSGRLSLHAGAYYDVGRASAAARGGDASLGLHRAAIGAEARYAWLPWLEPYARVAPGALRLDARVDDRGGRALEVGRWTWSVDAAAGVAVPLGPLGRRGAPLGHALVFAEGGYGFAGSVSMAAAPDAGDEGARAGAVALPALRPAGTLLRVGAGFAF